MEFGNERLLGIIDRNPGAERLSDGSANFFFCSTKKNLEEEEEQSSIISPLYKLTHTIKVLLIM